MATEDARYRQSSQYKLWSFSPSQLAELRTRTNAVAKTSISERLPSQNSSAPGSGANTPQPSDTDSALPEFLTPADELQLVNYYTVELLRAGKFIGNSTEIQATAAVFLRRFYVTNSIMTYPPTELLKTSLFFGAKAEGSYPGLAGFAGKFPNTKPENILAGEFLLCQGIRFSFDIKHPFRALEGIIMELRRYGDIDDKRIGLAHKRAREILKFSSLVTDAYFHFTPSQIMFAALSLADQGLVERVMQETFHHQPAPPADSTAADAAGNGGSKPKKSDLDKERISGIEMKDRVMSKIEACREMLAAEPPERFTDYWGKPESNNIIKPLNKKLKKCRDPDRWDLVALQQAKKEGAVKAAGEKNGSADDDGAVFGSDSGGMDGRDPKRRKVSKALADPFGPALQG